MLKIISIEIAHEIEDSQNDFVDVIVRDATGYSYVVIVTTPASLLKTMNNTSLNYIEPESLIIVKDLTQQIIEEAINGYASNDGYWLKLHHFAGTMDISILNNLVEEHR